MTRESRRPLSQVNPLALAVTLLASGVHAQSAQPATSKPEALETVIVTGIRGALQLANDVKRNAPQVMDAISAEDVGKLPDANVAEALQRVTGVQVTRVFGEGQSVSVRGLPLVRVEVDGRTLLGYSARLSPPENEQLGRNSGLDTVPSGLFGRLEVRKSPTAAQVEGGLSGSVNLVTPDPLDFRGNTLAVRAAAEYSKRVNKVQPVASALIAQQFMDRQFGVLLAVDHTERVTSTQAFERNNFFNRTGATSDLNGDGVADISGDRMQYEEFTTDRSRTGVTAEAQWRPSKALEFKAEAIWSQLKTEREQDFLMWRYAGKAITNPVFDGNFIVAGDSLGTMQQAGLYRAEPTESRLLALSAKWKPYDALTIKPELSISRGTLEQTIRQITIDSVNANVPGRFDYRAGEVPSLSLGNFDVTNIANYKPATNGVRANLLVANMEEKVGKLDLQHALQAGPLTGVSAGLRWRNLEARSNAYRSQITPTLAEIQPYLRVRPGDFLPDVGVSFPRPFLTTVAARDYILERASGGKPLLPNASRDYDLEERALAAYVMADFDGELFGMEVSANAGLRAVRTDFGVNTLLNGVTPVRDENRYTNTLPSGNLVLHVNSDFLVRLSGSRTLQQAGIAELAPSIFVNITNRTATGGNASLRPTLSDNLDLSFELYGKGSSLISGAVFSKRVSDVQANSTELRTFGGFEQLGAIPYTRPDNVGSARVKGLELGVQRFFDFLPAPFNGFGVIANYTLSDGEGDGGLPLVGVSKHSYNLIALYERGAFSARLAYNARDKAAFEFTQGRPSYIDKRSQLDLQFGYEFAKGMSLQIQAQNLNPKQSATVEFSQIGAVALNSYALAETRYSVGLRAKF
ncbi:MAG: TonB-dependent receptor [Burkholderiales bacterium]|nr:TonB-dependent receptor [Burkholderiales bacterium]